MNSFERKFITLENGEKFAYIDEGHGDKIILGCHGNYSSCQGMYYLVDNFKDNYRVIIPDNRGFGESSYNKPISKMEDFAHDIVLFAKAMGIDKAIVIGHSYGGGTAMEVAIQAPELVEKLVLIAPTSVGGYPLLKQGEGGKLLPFADIKEMENYPANRPIFDMMAKKDKEACLKFIANISPARASDPVLLERLCNETLKERCIVDVCWAMATWNITDFPGAYGQGNGNYKKIKAPIFLATAGKDTMVFPFMNDLNVNTLKLTGNLTHKHYADAGHAIYETNPKEFFPDLKEFLK